MTTHLATLQFEADGPAVTGAWPDYASALRTYRGWVGLYGSNSSVVICIIEETDGDRHVVRTWTAHGEAETSPDISDPTA
ncbi:hypothetical protein OH782_42440 (plasmid) [Streptomyces sp. NBC_01544]|uniref:hypothetical protein n=1 Tax=Streptomyces sp. NBC_01544 TaxID=2975871 RepID=UPI002F90BFB6